MSSVFFWKGVILGFSIAAPVGPIGILCIRRSLQFGRLSGFFSGLGAAAADGVYGIIAAFGLTFVSDFLMQEEVWLRLVGGLFLLYLGGKIFRAKAKDDSSLKASRKTLVSDFLSTFFLTVTNPMTIIAFLAIFAGMGLTSTPGDYGSAGVLVGGIVLGSALWWLLLSEGVTFFRKKISQEVMRWINRLAGLIIIGFGVISIASVWERIS